MRMAIPLVDSGDLLDAVLHEPEPPVRSEWSGRFRFTPAIERAFLRYYEVRAQRWGLLASALFSGYVGMQVMLLQIGAASVTPWGVLRLALLTLAAIALTVLIVAQVNRSADEQPLRNLTPLIIATLSVTCNFLLLEVSQSTAVAATIGVLPSLVLIVLMVRVRVRHRLPLVALIASPTVAAGLIFRDRISAEALVGGGAAALFALAVGVLLEYEARGDFLRQLQIVRFASTDPLSQVLNRHAFLERGAFEFARARRYGVPLALLLLDIDYFKRINDTYGHPAGDAVIAAVGQRARGQLRTSDLTGRVGGEEFAILLSDTDGPGAALVAERLRALLSSGAVIHQGRELWVTVSIGVAAISDADRSLDDLIARTDQWLYAAKQTGRNRVCTDAADAGGEEQLSVREVGA